MKKKDRAEDGALWDATGDEIWLRLKKPAKQIIR